MKTNHIITPFMLLSFFTIQAQEKLFIPEIDRIRLAEAFTLSEAIGNSLWKDWDKAPFALLLVTPDYEFLIRHPAPSPDFIPLGFDSLLKSDVFYRKRTQQLNLLATKRDRNSSRCSMPMIIAISLFSCGRKESPGTRSYV
jgi:hypothetical protein